MTAEFDTSTIFRRHPDTRYRNIGGEGIVVRQRVGEVLVVSEVGARVLDLLDGARSIAGVVEVLAQEYDIDPATLDADVGSYVRSLIDASVIEPVATVAAAASAS